MRVLMCAAICLLGAQLARGAALNGTVKCKDAAKACNVIVYAERALEKEGAPPPVRPVVLDQVNLAFIPHVLPVLVGTTVLFPNHDEVPHNVYSSSPAKIFNLGIYPTGASRKITFDKPGEVLLLCNIHPQMSAYILVLQQPYFTVADKEGRFSLKGLPAGNYKIVVWSPEYKPLSGAVEVKGAENLFRNFTLRGPR